MRLRFILTSVGVLVFILCAFGLSHAALDNKYYIRVISSPDEHPWQYDDSPLVPDDSNHPHTVSGVSYLYPIMIKAILSIQTPGIPLSPGKTKQKATLFQSDEQHSNGPR
jgi:hypothetical protein